MKKKQKYVCSNCGFEDMVWSGKCSNCGEWGTMEEFVEVSNQTGKKSQIKKARPLKDVEVDSSSRLVSTIEEFNRVLGGGLVRDSVSILTAKPGSGKSTLLLELSKDYSEKGLKVLYISGEESESQIKSRAERIMDKIPENIWLLSTTSMDNGISVINDLDPDIVFVDSIQTLSLSEYPSRPGSPVQTVECTNALVEIAKNKERPRAIIMIGHMTKADEMAGLRTLEHMVDTVLFLQSDMNEDLRILVSTKNRFGRTGEIGIFKMGEDGMKEVKNPSEEFLSSRKDLVVGSAIGLLKEGSRYIALEIESLISTAFQAYPIRLSESMNKDRLSTLVAIIEQRASIPLYDKNVIVKTVGGMKLSHQDSDLAVLMSIVSSALNKAIDPKTAFLAEVGLTGELKSVRQLEQRLNELKRLGFKKAYYFGPKIELEDFEAICLDNLSQVIKHVFNN